MISVVYAINAPREHYIFSESRAGNYRKFADTLERYCTSRAEDTVD